MNPPETIQSPEKRSNVSEVPPPRWWGRYVLEGNPPQTRFVIRWGRILGILCTLGLGLYLALATTLWGYYAIYRKIPEVEWIDVAVFPRFGRVQSALGRYYYAEAKKLWDAGSYYQSLMTARAAVLKNPNNLEARLFLGNCWQLAGRSDEAIRILKEGISYQPADRTLQLRLVETCQLAGRPREILKVLREELPAHGVDLLSGKEWIFQIAEVQAVLDLEGCASAEVVAARHQGLAEEPSAAPIMARIDWEAGRLEKARDRLFVALQQRPTDPAIHESYVESFLRLKDAKGAKESAVKFLQAFPDSLLAQIKILEAFGSRKGEDALPWKLAFERMLIRYMKTPEALSQLASLAAAQGWTDVTYLLYQHSLQERLNGFPFISYHIGALIKAGDFAAAETCWKDLAVRNGAQMSASGHLEAMVLSGVGRDSEAMQVVDRLRRDSEAFPERRKMIERIFKSFGFDKLAEQLASPKQVGSSSD